MKSIGANNLNYFSLLPDRADLRQHIDYTFATKTKFLIKVCASLCFISLLYNIIRMIINLSKRLEYWESLVFVIGDIIGALYYVGTHFIQRISIKLQVWALVLSSLIYSVMMTELHIYAGEEERLIGRILGMTPLFIFVGDCVMINFIYFGIPFVLSLVYPILRLAGIDFSYL